MADGFRGRHPRCREQLQVPRHGWIQAATQGSLPLTFSGPMGRYEVELLASGELHTQTVTIRARVTDEPTLGPRVVRGLPAPEEPPTLPTGTQIKPGAVICPFREVIATAIRIERSGGQIMMMRVTDPGCYRIIDYQPVDSVRIEGPVARVLVAGTWSWTRTKYLLPVN